MASWMDHVSGCRSNGNKTRRVSKDRETLYCSFCGKSQHEVKLLVAGPVVFICDECNDLASDIMLDEKA